MAGVKPAAFDNFLGSHTDWAMEGRGRGGRGWRVDREMGERRLGAVAHACNPSYSKGRHWEDHGSRPAWGDNL
jgi:hypothetical protein